tara:strand:- start:78 stop:965 length:888 start_codon:yes stop_codon:yes gene_type:complete
LSNKNLDKLVKNIIRDVDASESTASKNHTLQKNIIDQLRQLNQFVEENNIKNTDLEPIYQSIKGKLRTIEFYPVYELESEQEISKFDSKKVSEDRMNSIQKELEQKKWDEMYELLVRFMKENYHCCLKVKDVYKNKPLGKWVDTQRKLSRKAPDSFEENLKKLSDIKINDSIQVPQESDKNKKNNFDNIRFIFFEWSSSDANWSRFFRQLKRYYVENNHSLVPSNYSSLCGKDKLELGTWVLRMRQNYRDNLLPQDRIDKLKSIYFCFSTDLNNIIKNESERDNLKKLIESLNYD